MNDEELVTNSHIDYIYDNENKLIVDPYNETVLVVLNRIR